MNAAVEKVGQKVQSERRERLNNDVNLIRGGMVTRYLKQLRENRGVDK